MPTRESVQRARLAVEASGHGASHTRDLQGHGRVGHRLCVRFADPSVGWAVDEEWGLKFAYTTDGGAKWTSRTVPFKEK